MMQYKNVINHRIKYLEKVKLDSKHYFNKDTIKLINSEINWLNYLIDLIDGVVIFHNKNTGEELYSVYYYSDKLDDDWIDSFYTIKDAVDYIDSNKFKLVKFESNVYDC